MMTRLLVLLLAITVLLVSCGATERGGITTRSGAVIAPGASTILDSTVPPSTNSPTSSPPPSISVGLPGADLAVTDLAPRLSAPRQDIDVVLTAETPLAGTPINGLSEEDRQPHAPDDPSTIVVEHDGAESEYPLSRRANPLFPDDTSRGKFIPPKAPVGDVP